MAQLALSLLAVVPSSAADYPSDLVGGAGAVFGWVWPVATAGMLWEVVSLISMASAFVALSVVLSLLSLSALAVALKLVGCCESPLP